MYKPCIDDLVAEIDGVAALINIVAQQFQENDVTTAPQVVGDALFGLENYSLRIADSLLAMSEDQQAGGEKSTDDNKQLQTAICKELEKATLSDLNFCFYYLRARRESEE